MMPVEEETVGLRSHQLTVRVCGVIVRYVVTTTDLDCGAQVMLQCVISMPPTLPR